jgi:hypothetical protein
MAKYDAVENGGVWGVLCNGRFHPMTCEQEAKSFASELNAMSDDADRAYRQAKAARMNEKKRIVPRYSLTPRRLDQYNGQMFLTAHGSLD